MREICLFNERHGFECMGKIQINDSPPAFPMIRESKN